MINSIAEKHVPPTALRDDPADRGWPGDRFQAPSALGAWFLLGIVLLYAGPILNSHETIVAQSARQILQSGEWIVPRYLDAPFLVKPPLSPWLAAIAGYLLPTESGVGLPVSTAAARLPSFIATLLTLLVLYALARSIYGRPMARSTAFVYATCAGTMAFALNATAEALLTFFCTWAYAEFWWSRHAEGRAKSFHQVRFYVAFSLAMMAKAPMPLMVVGVPLAAWWWTERSARLLGVRGFRAAPAAARLFARRFLARTRLALTDLGVWWGTPIAFGALLAWLWAASTQVPYVWKLWQTEYLDRLHDSELWVGTNGPWYYLPVLLGFTAPWLLSLPEAIAAPFLKAYGQHRRPILYAWYWVVLSVGLLSIMRFKQDYYLVPVLPGCALLLGPVLHKLFSPLSPAPTRATVRGVTALVLVVAFIVPVVCFIAFRDELADTPFGAAPLLLVLLAAVFMGGVILAAVLFIRQRKPLAFCTVGLTGLAVFALIWIAEGMDPRQLRDQQALVAGLRQAGVAEDADVFWADSLPDGRVTFYGNRRVRQLGDPFEMRAGLRGEDKMALMLDMGAKICTMLEEQRVYLVLERERYGMLKSLFRPKTSVLFEVDRAPKGRDKDDWLVITGSGTPTTGTGE